MCIILTSILETVVDNSLIAPQDNRLVMNLLLFGLKLPSASMLDLIIALVKCNATKLPPGELLELLCSHSCFLDVLLSENTAKCKFNFLSCVLFLNLY